MLLSCGAQSGLLAIPRPGFRDMPLVAHSARRANGRLMLRDNQKATCSDNQPMHLMVEHASLGATPVKPEAAGGGGLKGQALRA